MYFIETVTTYSVNTAKARPIQNVANQFEHTMLEESVFESLAGNLKALVEICNRTYRGNTLEFHHTSGQISVRYPASGTEKMVVAISYAPVLHHFRHRSEIRQEIQRILELKNPADAARYIIEYTKKTGNL